MPLLIPPGLARILPFRKFPSFPIICGSWQPSARCALPGNEVLQWADVQLQAMVGVTQAT